MKNCHNDTESATDPEDERGRQLIAYLNRSLEIRSRRAKDSPNRHEFSDCVRLLDLLGVVQQRRLKLQLLQEAELHIALGLLRDVARGTGAESDGVALTGELETPVAMLDRFSLSLYRKPGRMAPSLRVPCSVKRPMVRTEP